MATAENNKAKVLEIWLANPTLPYCEICKLANIADITFYRYRHDAAFMEQYKKECKKRFASLEAKAISYLDQQMDLGNWNAIKYVLDGTGYKPEDNVNLKTKDTFTINIVDDKEV